MGTEFLKRLGIRYPIIQAPMAGISTPGLAAAVCNAGALGSLGLGAATPEQAHDMMQATRALTGQKFNVNVFCHATAKRDSTKERAWLARLAPEFQRLGAEAPGTLHEIYAPFQENDALLEAIADCRPGVVSFHFGLPTERQIEILRQTGAVLLGGATSQDEADACVAAGMDAIIAQGWEAGGHRGIFDPEGPDARLDCLILTRQLLRNCEIPIIAAGGIMDGTGIATVLSLGAVAAQLGTAFVACPESAADAAYRAALENAVGPEATQMTRVISGRPSRCLNNDFVRWGAEIEGADVPAYPCTYDAGKRLNAAARAVGQTGYGAQWAGQGAGHCRKLGAASLVETLVAEMEAAQP